MATTLTCKTERLLPCSFVAIVTHIIHCLHYPSVSRANIHNDVKITIYYMIRIMYRGNWYLFFDDLLIVSHVYHRQILPTIKWSFPMGATCSNFWYTGERVNKTDGNIIPNLLNQIYTELNFLIRKSWNVNYLLKKQQHAVELVH